MTVVLDASAAVAVASGRAESARVRETLGQAEWVIAPDLFAAEVANTFWKYSRMAGVPTDDCRRMLAVGLDLVDDFMPMKDQALECLAEALRNNHPAYDLMYVILARRHGAMLVTQDRRLASLAKALGVATL